MITVETPILYGKTNADSGNSVFPVIIILAILAGTAFIYFKHTTKKDETGKN